MQAVLSLDFGTNGVRAGVFAVESRQAAAIGEVAYPTRLIPPNRAEQDPADWWRALCTVARIVLAEAGEPEIHAICVATFASTVVLCDRGGNVLAPAILWMDARAAEEARATSEVDHPVLAYSGGSDAAEWLVPKAMWAALHEPDLWARTEIICEALDYINFRLTGEWVGSLMNATCKWNFDSRKRQLRPDLYALFGIPELAERLPPRIVDIGSVIGPACAEALSELGIRGRPLVVQGGIDAHMGTFGADTLEPGAMLLIGGTSNVILTQVPDDGSEIAGIWGPYPNALTPGLRMIEGGQVSAGSILKWLADDIFCLDEDGRARLIEEAERIGPEAAGLLALDFFMGCRTPYRDPNLRGAFLGLTLSHDRATIYRAAMTAVCLGTANIIADLEEQGLVFERLVVAGGIRRNPLWLQSTVDAIGRRVELAATDNLTLLGGAAAASVGMGSHADMRCAAAAWRAPTTRMAPDPARHERYRLLLADYRDAVDRLSPILRTLAARAEGNPRKAGLSGVAPDVDGPSPENGHER